jgi:hypothetical protein
MLDRDDVEDDGGLKIAAAIGKLLPIVGRVLLFPLDSIASRHLKIKCQTNCASTVYVSH